MSNQPLVSVAAVNFNNCKYVIETLESIKKQDYINIEIIIVDDASTDDSLKIIHHWIDANKSLSITLVAHEKNKGVCAACNSALTIAVGKYFSLIATDDIMLPEKISSQVSFMESQDETVAMVYTDAFQIKEDGSKHFGTFIQRHLPSASEAPSGDFFEKLVQGNFIPAMANLIRTNIIKDLGCYDEELKYEDYDLWLRISRKYKIMFLDHPTINYRIRANSVSQSIKGSDWSYYELPMLNKHAELDVVREQMKYRIYNLYFDGFKCKNLLKEYRIFEKKDMGLTYNLMKINFPGYIWKGILTILKKYR